MTATNANTTAGQLAQGITGAAHIGDPITNLSGAQFNDHLYSVPRPALRGTARQQVTGQTGPEENPFQTFGDGAAVSTQAQPDHGRQPHYAAGESANANS